MSFSSITHIVEVPDVNNIPILSEGIWYATPKVLNWGAAFSEITKILDRCLGGEYITLPAGRVRASLSHCVSGDYDAAERQILNDNGLNPIIDMQHPVLFGIKFRNEYGPGDMIVLGEKIRKTKAFTQFLDSLRLTVLEPTAICDPDPIIELPIHRAIRQNHPVIGIRLPAYYH